MLVMQRIGEINAGKIIKRKIMGSKTIKFKSCECFIETSMYSNNDRLAIVLCDNTDGEMIAVATVNLPHSHLPDDHVFIKDYSENEGIMNILINAGIIDSPTLYVPSGYVQIPMCKLHPEVMIEYERK